MGLLDAKTRILDVVLTNSGRYDLSRNQLNFSYFAFSDDGIDYSGSLSSSSQLSGSTLDDYVHINTFAFEPLRREDKAINNFLFTMPLQSEVITQFNSSVTGSIVLGRKYDVETLENVIMGANQIEQLLAQEEVLDYVIIVEDIPISNQDRNINHSVSQFSLSESPPLNGLADLLSGALK